MLRIYFMSMGVLVFATSSLGGPYSQNKTSRESKQFSLFQVITFENENCLGSTRNGTCYTASECTDRGGSTSGTCASGYGVCCIFSVNCGSQSAENNTYLSETSSAGLSSCSYTICKSQSNICRIRFDFTTFSIAGPVNGLIENTNAAGGAIGDCTMDQFSVTAPGGVGSPVICGFNMGQHMVVDASDQCHEAVFNFGGSAMTPRSWDIKVTQFACNEEMGGEDVVAIFDAVQDTFYNACFQDLRDVCSTSLPCQELFPVLTFPRAPQRSRQVLLTCLVKITEFVYVGVLDIVRFVMSPISPTRSLPLLRPLKLSSADLASGVGTQCSEDYLIIPGAFDLLGDKTLETVDPATTQERLCGRILSAITGKMAADVYDNTDPTKSASVCSKNTPFVIGFKSDGDEVAAEEMGGAPGGIVGFSLNYQQIKC
ncbi:hypothetical protein TCAL_13001 [Tigriopus californicus]|uniref:CUB domain-containing protein n=1 Tax=Tigriopus californicus TaxID=6832 RepID=A0A553P4U2_TIGCA|nr:hypothetical protein TCAL_13001 [Tigriopus californicus]